ncbi:TPA: plasmid mobilization relaxosome protein MobC [Streptococcus suis]
MKNVDQRSRPIKKEFYVDEEENEYIKQRMQKANVKNFSAFARFMMITGEIIVNNFEELRQLRVAINRIGVNVNQIAKRVNENDATDMKDIAEVLSLLQNIENEVNVTIKKYERQFTKRSSM